MNRRVILAAVVLAVVGVLAAFLVGGRDTASGTAKVVTSNFVGYDLARAVSGDASEVEMLLKPGMEAHDFEPTPEDIVKIREADLFIYVGGESEEWIEELLEDNEVAEDKTLRLMDLVEVREEDLSLGGGPEGADGDLSDGESEGANGKSSDGSKEYDEHIWTSLVNAREMLDGVWMKMSEVYPEREAEFSRNYEKYDGRLAEIDGEMREIVAEGAKKELIFGDRFPFLYFVDEYGLDYYAAFPGCAEQTEASSETVAFLIDKVKEDDVKVVLKVEMSSDKLAKTIAEETGAEVMTLNAAHNVSQEDFENGVTYAEIMEGNEGVLREALR